MVESAQRQRQHRAATFGRQRSSTPTATPKSTTPGNVPLRPPIDSLDIFDVPPWSDVSHRQGAVTNQTLTDALVGEVIALYDRNLMSEPWRKVYAIRDEDDSFVLYSATGLIIDAETTPKGRQSVADLVSEFAVEGFYYKPPTPRPTPTARRSVSLKLVIHPRQQRLQQRNRSAHHSSRMRMRTSRQALYPHRRVRRMQRRSRTRLVRSFRPPYLLHQMHCT